MAVISLDLGGTKLAGAVWSDNGDVLIRDVNYLENRKGSEVASLIVSHVERLRDSADGSVRAIGVSVPGIAYRETGTVWAPNIPGWESFPLRETLENVLSDTRCPVVIESDRTCFILGETWRGAAKNCKNAIYLAVGTGIGAGILVDGRILHGASDIAGSIGWMALEVPFREEFSSCGCFETYASGAGIAKTALKLLKAHGVSRSQLADIPEAELSARNVFEAYRKGDKIAGQVFDICVMFWGMATANLVSIFNPESIIFGGGIFGPASVFIDRIRNEASKWAQPLSMMEVRLELSDLAEDGALIGAARLAFESSGIPVPS